MRSDRKSVTREASRATRTFLFFPKGALTHHPDGAVVSLAGRAFCEADAASTEA